jgi:lipopolysaccharide biosynthesis glycosyltransferase
MASGKDPIYLATYADQDYLQHASVMIRSLEDVADRDESYVVYLFCSGLNDSLRERASRTFSAMRSDVTVHMVERDFELPDTLRSKRSHLNATIYNKLRIYEHLPQDLERIVFLDADVVLSRDPAGLYRQPLDGQPMAGVRDKFYLQDDVGPDLREALGLDDYEQYFNSGVLVVDLPKWRAKNIPERALRFAAENWDRTGLHDQDALNAVIAGRWQALSPLWNPRGLNELPGDDGRTEILTNFEIYRRDIQNLIHYSGRNKPWLYRSTHPKKDEYLRVLGLTGFSDYRFPDWDLATAARKVGSFVKAKAAALRTGGA